MTYSDADTLVLLQCYIIIKSGVSGVYATLALMEDFILAPAGEAAYCLVTLQTAVNAILTM